MTAGKRKPATKARVSRAGLAERLREAEETLDAIRSGHVDALVVQGPTGDQVFTLKGTDHRYRQLVETMNEGALLVGASGTIAYGNARFAALVGLPLERVIGSMIFDHVTAAGRTLIEAMLRTRGDDAPLKAEAELVTPDGDARPVYLSATPGWDEGQQLTCLIVTDLGDQQRSRETVAAEHLSTQIVEQAAEGVVVCDLEGVVVRASQAALRVAAGNPLLMRFEHAFPFGQPGEPRAGSRVVALALRGETVKGLEVALLREQTTSALLLSAGPITGGDGKVLGCVISFVDITERKVAAEERLRLFDAAEAANRAKDEFLAMLGHELRNPLAPITSALELMKLRGDEVFKREREVIERQVKHLVTLVGDLLDVSRISRGKVELDLHPVELRRVVDKALEAVEPMLSERHHRVVVTVFPGLWVHGDETRLCQVLSNLLTNAAKYTPPAGTIEIHAERRGGEVVLRIRDNGVGIPAELIPTLFDLFVQGKRSLDRAAGGLGLGLAIVRNLVALHGGRVEVRSDGLGNGSEFEVRLPLLDHTVAEPAPAAAAPPDADHVARGKRILVVDDNVDAAETVSDALQAMGHQTCVAFDGPSALEKAVGFAPEIALLDIGLPAMDGYELARRLRALTGKSGELRLIALSGYGTVADRARSTEAGFDVHLVKPIRVSMLEQTVRRVGRS